MGGGRRFLLENLLHDVAARFKLGFCLLGLACLQVQIDKPAMPAFMMGFNGNKLPGKSDCLFDLTALFVFVDDLQKCFQGHQAMLFAF